MQAEEAIQETDDNDFANKTKQTILEDQKRQLQLMSCVSKPNTKLLELNFCSASEHLIQWL
jgi:hypothetical protein